MSILCSWYLQTTLLKGNDSGTAALEDIIKADRVNISFTADSGWDEEGLIKDAKQNA